jgi:hypothetical protein
LLRKHLALFVLALLALVVIAGCVPAPASTPPPPAAAGASGPAGETAAPSGPAVETGTATPTAAAPEAGLRPIAVSNVIVDVGVGSPIPVDAFVSGEWPDLCAQLALITQRFEGNTFEITLLATAADPACPPDYLGLPFRIAIPINVAQLPDGEYIVSANGASTTFTVPIPSPAARPPAEETAAPGPPTTVTLDPTGGAVTHYQGPNPYRATPRFDVAYDAAVWEYVEDDGSGRQSQLKHRSLPGCAVWLRAGPVGATEVATVWRAERAWIIAQVQSNIIQYSSAEGDINWIFGLLLPEAWSGLGNSACQDAAEQVIDTFAVVE